MIRKSYPTDLTDEQWARIVPLIPPAKPGGRRRTVNVREIVNAILYFVRTGCQ
jgi:putative transposase